MVNQVAPYGNTNGLKGFHSVETLKNTHGLTRGITLDPASKAEKSGIFGFSAHSFKALLKLDFQ